MADRPTPVCHCFLSASACPEDIADPSSLCIGSRCAAWSPAKSGGTLGTCGLVPAPCVPWNDPAKESDRG